MRRAEIDFLRKYHLEDIQGKIESERRTDQEVSIRCLTTLQNALHLSSIDEHLILFDLIYKALRQFKAVTPANRAYQIISTHLQALRYSLRKMLSYLESFYQRSAFLGAHDQIAPPVFTPAQEEKVKELLTAVREIIELLPLHDICSTLSYPGADKAHWSVVDERKYNLFNYAVEGIFGILLTYELDDTDTPSTGLVKQTKRNQFYSDVKDLLQNHDPSQLVTFLSSMKMFYDSVGFNNVVTADIEDMSLFAGLADVFVRAVDGRRVSKAGIIAKEILQSFGAAIGNMRDPESEGLAKEDLDALQMQYNDAWRNVRAKLEALYAPSKNRPSTSQAVTSSLSVFSSHDDDDDASEDENPLKRAHG